MAFYALGINPFETAQELQAFKTEQGHPWPTAVAPVDLVKDYRITIRSTKVAIDRNGIIVFRAGYGVETNDTWHQVFQKLSS